MNCPQPSGVTVTAGTGTPISKLVGWDAGPLYVSGTQIQCRIPGTNGSNVTALAGAGVTSKMLSELLPLSNYQMRLRHECNGLFSPWRYKPFQTGALRVTSASSQERIGLEVFPNPSDGVFNLLLEAASSNQFTDGRVVVTDVVGKVVFEWNGGFDGTLLLPVDLSEAGSGQYFIRAWVGDEMLTERVVVAR